MSRRIHASLRRLCPQPALGGATAALALGALVAAWRGLTHGIGGPEGVLAVLLLVLISAAFQWPLHIQRQTKVYMTSVPYYLLAVLVAPPLAATVAGLGALVGELSVRRRRGNTGSFVASQVGRRTLVVLLGALVADRLGDVGMRVPALLGAAVVLEVGDIVTCPLSLAPLWGERPRRVLVMVARKAYAIEAAQYLLGVLGALAARQQLWTAILLVLPTVLVYLAFRAMARAEDARRDAEDARRTAEEARRTAEDAVRVRDNFLLTASHDLRTPLTNIIGRLDLVQARLDGARVIPDDWLRAQTHSLGGSARRMGATVEEITDAAQLQMGQRLALHLEPVDIGLVVRTVVGTSPWGEAPSLVLDTSPGVVVEGDRARLERVVQNIIENAIKYNRAARPIRVEVARQGSWAMLVVRDEGVGIPADELPHVFTRFYRASTATGTPGTGIGLAGAKTIVEQHGGAITIETAVGCGTAVTVLLPRVVAVEHADTPIEDPPRTRERVAPPGYGPWARAGRP